MKKNEFMRKSPLYLERFSRDFEETSNFPNLLSAETEHMHLLYTLLVSANTLSPSDPYKAKLLDVVRELKACRKGQPCLYAACRTCSRTQRQWLMEKNFSLAEKLAGNYSVLSLNFNSAAISPEDFNEDILIRKVHKIDMQLKEWVESTDMELPIGGAWGLGYHNFDNLLNKDAWVPQVRLMLPNDEKLHQDVLSFMLESGESCLYGIIENAPVKKLKVNTVNDALIAAYDPSWFEYSCSVVTEDGKLMLKNCQQSPLCVALIDGVLVQAKINISDIDVLRKPSSIGRKSDFDFDWDEKKHNYGMDKDDFL
ncbi:hypothetical protein CRN79_16730 [Serratia fonticola]|uniref:hypothetical protein n=1 Tax=Serratia fonticola TaxID=47917 RepID=UPI000BFB7A99|nr:hypothetical protein [Serratia fonticola]ATM77386.1 hypothetical protein CRN79_16730 [Serratia fonticola]